ncbi:MAG: PEP/pyruvate-binding domain-containing protein [Planctomycetota bacterium]
MTAPVADQPVPLAEAIDVEHFGAKAVHLGAAARAGLPVPRGIALPVAFVENVIDGAPRALAALYEIEERVGFPLAVRSSAIGEDSENASFAGQHLSVLNLTTTAGTIQAVRDVRESGHTDAARAYREKQGLMGPVRVAVVIQHLVDSEVAGVLFTRNPISGADERVIEAAWGLGEAVVAGMITPDQFRLSRDGAILQRTAGEKDIAVRRTAEGTEERPVSPHLVAKLCLDDAMLAQLHDVATRCEEVFGGGPDSAGLDLEWAFSDGKLWLLQCRAISTTTKSP